MRDEIVWAGGIFVAVVVTAALVNRFNVSHLPRIRRTVILFFLYIAALGVELGLGALGVPVWAGRLRLAAELLRALTLVSVGATLLFSVVLSTAGIAIPMIASDLLIGVGYFAAALGVLSGHGLDPSGALATGAVVSAVLAISLQSTLGNILGGVALQLDGSVHEGDWIQLADGRQGRVRAIRWRHTVVETRDWSTVIVPNALLLANNIILLGKRGGKDVPQRMAINFNVDFRYAPTKVVEVVETALHASPIEGVAVDPKPNCVCLDFGREGRESVAMYMVRYWLTDLSADERTNSRVRARLFTALRRAGIPLAVPAQVRWVEVQDEARIAKKTQKSIEERLAAIHAVSLFRALTEAELETLATGMSHVVYTAGEVITRQGAVAHYLYVLSRGRAEIRTTIDPDGPGPRPPESLVVAKLEAPEVFGEMGLMTGEKRLADVVALTDVECYRLGKETFEQVLLARPEIATELSAKLAARRVELIGARDDLDAASKTAREASERERILGSIRTFFGL